MFENHPKNFYFSPEKRGSFFLSLGFFPGNLALKSFGVGYFWHYILEPLNSLKKFRSQKFSRKKFLELKILKEKISGTKNS